MDTTPRRSKIALPPSEVSYLAHLPTDEGVLLRVYELFRAGWPLQELAQHTKLRPSVSYLRNKFAEIAEETTGRPLPDMPPTPTEQAAAESRSSTVGWKYSARKITVAESVELQRLSALSKTHRSTYASTHPSTVAVGQYVTLIKHLRDDEKISLPDIATAARVDVSTIRRRYKS